MPMANHTCHTSTDSQSEVANYEINEDYSEEETSAYVKSRKLAKEGNSDGVPQKSNLVDNKRKKLEKLLSAHQRDLIMVRIAREELEVKKKMLKFWNNQPK